MKFYVIYHVALAKFYKNHPTPWMGEHLMQVDHLQDATIFKTLGGARRTKKLKFANQPGILIREYTMEPRWTDEFI